MAAETLLTGRDVGHRRRVVAALLSDGDSRLAIDPVTGANKYLCRPEPAAGLVAFASCTASPIGHDGFARAADVFHTVSGGASPRRRAQLLAEHAWRIEARLLRYFGVADQARVVLRPSGTDALLTAALMIAAERPAQPITAILPQAAETGTGVGLAARCRRFDGPATGEALSCCHADTVEVALRSTNGDPLGDDEVNAAFSAAVAAAAGRPVIYLTHGTKTGLIAPTAPPAGTDVIVDACQGRIAPGQVAAYLRRGWPVVVTGSKFFGGPAFSGAVLFPLARFPALPSDEDVGLGTVLRWTVPLDVIDSFAAQSPCMAALLRDRATLVAREMAAVPALVPVAGAPVPGCCWSDMPSIFTFAVRNPCEPARLLSVADLGPLYRRLGQAGVLLGQPVGLGAFGGLRIAIGAQDLVDGHDETGLRRVFEKLAEATGRSPRAG